jgi:hypothetical protein
MNTSFLTKDPLEEQRPKQPKTVSGTCAACEYWRPEPVHKLWGRCGRVDHAMQYGAVADYPYDKMPHERVRLSSFDDRGRISTYHNFGCNRHSPSSETATTAQRPTMDNTRDAIPPAAPIPHKCPVCDGSGLVSRPPYVAGDQREWSSSSCGPWPCKSCVGSGLLWAVPPNIQTQTPIMIQPN